MGGHMNERVNLKEKLASLSECWVPKIVGELNGQLVKIGKAAGEYVWHQHDEEDEMFMIVEGRLDIHLRDRVIELGEGDFYIVPRGVEHKPVAPEGVAGFALFEPASTRNTGKVDHDYTIEPDRLEHI